MISSGRRNAIWVAHALLAPCADELDREGVRARLAARKRLSPCPRSTPVAATRHPRGNPQKGITMRCAHPQCRQEAHSLQEGTLRLLELAVPVEERVIRSDTGFPVVAVPSRYFWLCSDCSQRFTIRRWTPAGLILDPRSPEEGEKSLLVKIPPSRSVSRSRLQVSMGQVA